MTTMDGYQQYGVELADLISGKLAHCTPLDAGMTKKDTSVSLFQMLEDQLMTIHTYLPRIDCAD